jgi:hypothetical protein
MHSDLKRLIALPILGDAYHDRERLALAHSIIMNGKDYETTDRLQALREIDRTMGVTRRVTLVELKEYVTEASK